MIHTWAQVCYDTPMEKTGVMRQAFYDHQGISDCTPSIFHIKFAMLLYEPAHEILVHIKYRRSEGVKAQQARTYTQTHQSLHCLHT